MPTLADVVSAAERLYDPALAESWDAIGLGCGDPDAEVRRILFAVDPVAVTIDEAIDQGVDLLFTHHPLLLRGVQSVAATTYKGRLLHRMIRAGVALFTAHTNADAARPGVSDALARCLALRDLRPLRAAPIDPLDKIVTFVPHADADRVVDALAAAGAGRLGDYSRCAWLGSGTGTFLPGAGARPSIGAVGEIAQVPETRIEMVLRREYRPAVMAALRSAHPYEEPAYDVFELAPVPSDRGTGRVGDLDVAMPLREFTAYAARRLPAVAGGLRAAGDPHRPIRTVAVVGGAGDSFLADAAAAGVDAYLTADLRHHPASERLESGGPALIDAPHWATEWPWLTDAADRIRAALNDTVETLVSELVTDPWTVHAASPAGNTGRSESFEEPTTAP